MPKKDGTPEMPGDFQEREGNAGDKKGKNPVTVPQKTNGDPDVVNERGKPQKQKHMQGDTDKEGDITTPEKTPKRKDDKVRDDGRRDDDTEGDENKYTDIESDGADDDEVENDDPNAKNLE